MADGCEVKLTFHTDKVVKAIDDAQSKLMSEAVDAVHKTVVEETLGGTRSGRTYYVPGTRRTYTASAPGEPPAVATAELRQNIKTSVGSEGKTVVGMVGTDKIQGKMTEFGTRNMVARPWLRVSFEKAMPKIKEIFGKKWPL